MKHIAVALSLILVIGQTGCSFLMNRMVPLGVSCSDPEAELFVDGNPIGKGNTEVMVTRDQVHTVMARKGDRANTVAVGTKTSTAGILDLIGTFLFLLPVVGFLTPGCSSLDRDHVSIVLPNVTVIQDSKK